MQFKTYKTKTQILDELQHKLVNKISESPINWKEIPHKRLIEEFVDKLCHRKLFLIRLITDCIEYTLYNYFSVAHFLDSRGRSYPRLIYMNINTNHPSKLFVKLYDPNKSGEFNEIIHQTIYKLLQYKSPRNKLKALDIKNIDKENEKLVEKYILSLCDQNSTIEYVQDLLNNSIYDYKGTMNLLRDIKPKKEKERLFIHSLIRSERMIRQGKKISNRQRFVNYAEKDARSSGLQMISILFCSKSLAKWANLLNGETVDIYSTITKACKQHKEKLLAIAERTFETFQCENFLQSPRTLVPLKTEQICQMIEKWKTQRIPSLLLHTWINIDILSKKIEYKDLNVFLKEFTQYYNKDNLDMFKNYSAQEYNDFKKLIPKYEVLIKRLSTNYPNVDIQTAEKLLIIQHAVRFAIIVKQKFSFLELSPIWDSRSLYKQAIMTRFYNSTPFGRRKDFIACISEKHLLPRGYSLSSDFMEFLEFLDHFFLQYLTTIKDSDLLDKLSTHLSKQKGVRIRNSFFNIYISPKKMETYRLLTGSKKHTIFDNIDKAQKNPQMSIKLFKTTEKIKPIEEPQQKENTSETTKKTKKYARRRPISDPDKIVDHKKLKSTVGPNIIHSMDSSIVHYMRRLINKINYSCEELREKQGIPLFQLGLEMNHDCYILTMPVLLPILLEECYLRLVDTDYMRYISGLSEEDIKSYQRMSGEEFVEILTPINPDFIK